MLPQVNSAIEKFTLLYDYDFIEQNGPFNSVDEMVESLGMTELIQQSGLSYLTSNGISKEFAEEIIESATRVNYGQNIDEISAVGSLVSMAGSGMTVAGGNYQIFDKFLQNSNASVHYNTEVMDIRKNENDKWNVLLKDDINAQNNEYDIVIIATPIPLFDIPYVNLHVTLLSTNQTTYDDNFGFGKSPPQMIVTTDELSRKEGTSLLEFNSINYVQKASSKWSDNDENIVKIFSDHEWSNERINDLFREKNPEWIHKHTFDAYPYLKPMENPKDLPPFEIDTNLYYTSPFGEYFFSNKITNHLSNEIS